MWQTLEYSFHLHGSRTLSLLSTLHTGRPLKLGANLSSPYMSGVIVLMAGSLIFTLLLGVAMAFRLGHRRAASVCLIIGVVVPLILIVWCSTPNQPS